MEDFIRDLQRREKAIFASWENLNLENLQLKLMEELRYNVITERCWPKMTIYYESGRFYETDIPCFDMKFLGLGKLIYKRFQSKLKSKKALAYFVYGQFKYPLVQPFDENFLTFLCIRKNSIFKLYVAEIKGGFATHYKEVPNFERNLTMPEILISW